MGWFKREAARPKLCLDCVHFITGVSRCSEKRNEKLDLVTGCTLYKYSPENMRGDANWAGSNGCGSEGAWFKAMS